MSEAETNEEASADSAIGEQIGGDEKYAPDELSGEPAVASKSRDDVNLDLILDVSVSLALRVGSTNISIRQLVNLAEGSVVALDRLASEPLDVLANGTLVAHGEIVVVNGNFGVRLTDVVSPAERIETLN